MLSTMYSQHPSETIARAVRPGNTEQSDLEIQKSDMEIQRPGNKRIIVIHNSDLFGYYKTNQYTRNQKSKTGERYRGHYRYNMFFKTFRRLPNDMETDNTTRSSTV